MADIGSIMIVLEESDTLAPLVVMNSAEDLRCGINLCGATLWMRDGYDNAMEDCDRLMAAVVEVKAELRKKARDLAAQEETKVNASPDANDLGSPEDQKVEF